MDKCPAGMELCTQTGIGGFVICHTHRMDVARRHHADGTPCEHQERRAECSLAKEIQAARRVVEAAGFYNLDAFGGPLKEALTAYHAITQED